MIITKRLFLFFFLFSVILVSCRERRRIEIKHPPGFGEMVFIPAGEFIFGAGESESLASFTSPEIESDDAKPSQNVYLKGFYLDKYEVPYEQFLRFDPEFAYQGGKYSYPVRGVTWYQADAFCRYAKKRLPREEEWEKAARGEEGFRYPWGNKFDPAKLNVRQTLLPAGSYQTDISPYGVYDLGGNLSEWTASWYKAYPGSNYKNEYFGEKYKVARGGSISRTEHNFLEVFYQSTFRHPVPPDKAALDLGFRCAR